MARATSDIARVDFVAEADFCSCGAPLAVYKSRSRTVSTIKEGTFETREVFKACTEDPSHPVARSQALAQRVKPRQRFGYDVIVHVGLARYKRCMRRSEICKELCDVYGIETSEAGVSNLCDRFLCYLEALHLSRAPELAAEIAAQGGYPLHIDATNDRGKGGLCVTMDGLRDWVLVAERIPIESEEVLKPLVERTVQLFGSPINTMRDLGHGMAKAVTPLANRGTPDLICHFHFLGAVGKALFDTPHEILHNTIKKSKVRSDIRKLLLSMKKQLRAGLDGPMGHGRMREQLCALAKYLLDGDGSKHLPYPFSLPHHELFLRLAQLDELLASWIPFPRSVVERKAIKSLERLVKNVLKDQRVLDAIDDCNSRWIHFSELRTVLSLTESELPTPQGRARQKAIASTEHKRLEQIEQATDQYLAELRNRVATAGKKSPEAIILKKLDRYFPNLFDHPVVYDENGEIIAIAERTNNIPEHFFGHQKQLLRRRVARKYLGRDLEDQPAQVAFVYNLDHEDYVRIVCESLDNLPAAFAQLDDLMLRDGSILTRTNRDTRLYEIIRELLNQPEGSPNPPRATRNATYNSAGATVD